jgi:hypothetical protein
LSISEGNPLIAPIINLDVPQLIEIIEKIEKVFNQKKEKCKQQAFDDESSKYTRDLEGSNLHQLQKIIGDIDDSLDEGQRDKNEDIESQIDIERQSQAQVDDSLSSDSPPEDDPSPSKSKKEEVKHFDIEINFDDNIESEAASEKTSKTSNGFLNG